MEKLTNNLKIKHGVVLVKSIRIQVFFSPSDNTYNAVIKKKDGTTFLGYAGYPHEAIKFAAESLASKIKNSEDLIYDAWE